MEPIDAWMEEELQRNGLMPKVKVGAATVNFTRHREDGLKVPEDYKHPEHAYEEPEFFLTGELYSPPELPKLVGLSENEAAKITTELVNVLTSADMVTMPEHYARFKIEPIRFSVENNLNFFQANIVKYILRYDAKNGMEDLKKARRYLDMLIKWVEGDPDWWRKPE